MTRKATHIKKLVEILARETRTYTVPLSESIIDEFGKKPFLILISCLLSLRAKDSMTIHICRELFAEAQSPEEILALPVARLEKILYRIGFYRNKARTIRNVSKDLLDRYNGEVPSSMKELLSIKGVGRKTANLVQGLAFDTPSICVDIHVHRISNRLGLVETQTPDQTELELKKMLPKKYWVSWNRLLVMWGQNICAPVSPRCSTCALRLLCPQIGIIRSR